MSYKIFKRWRPKAQFKVGQLVVMKAPWSSANHYLLIEKREWSQSGASPKNLWLYGGPVFRAEREKLVRSTLGFRVPESDLEAIPGT